jgi:hypothetical protein
MALKNRYKRFQNPINKAPENAYQKNAKNTNEYQNKDKLLIVQKTLIML